MTATRPTAVKRYATYRPILNEEHVLYGEATLFPRCGYIFQQDGCDWTVAVSYRDRRLVLGELVTNEETQLPRIAVA